MPERSVRVQVCRHGWLTPRPNRHHQGDCPHCPAQPGIVDLVRELARPARHDHRRLTTSQTVAENTARLAATSLALAAHGAAQACVAVLHAARGARVVAHLWRHQ